MSNQHIVYTLTRHISYEGSDLVGLFETAKVAEEYYLKHCAEKNMNRREVNNVVTYENPTRDYVYEICPQTVIGDL